jgi:uncharacterized protein (TIGR02646 family)
MRFIDKSKQRCTDFDDYVATERPRNWDTCGADIKLKLHQHLLGEQQYLCIYCQQSIPVKSTKDVPPVYTHPSHIEHIKPKDVDKYPHLTFEYSNLSVSCNGFNIKEMTTISPNFCGHFKRNNYEETLFLNPTETLDIENCFEYTINGEIKATNKDVNRANYTIRTLHLDSQKLIDMREEQYLIISEETLTNGLNIVDYLDENQKELPQFHSMLKQLFFI